MDVLTRKRVEKWAEESEISGSTEERFEKYAASIYLAETLRGDTKPLEYIAGGSGNDGGVDAFVIVINGDFILDPQDLDSVLEDGDNNHVQVTFIQAKTSEKFEMNMIARFLSGVETIAQSAISGSYVNTPERWLTETQTLSAVIDNIDRFDSEKIAVELYYVTTSTNDGSGPTSTDNQVQETLRRLDGLQIFESPLEIVTQGKTELYNRLKDINGPRNVKFTWPKRESIPAENGINEAYIGVANGCELLKLLTENSKRRFGIFSDNVRLYQGHDNEVNQKIRETLNSDKLSLFPYLNNGLTIVATELKTTGDNLQLSGYQVVNGGQTSIEIIEWAAGLPESENHRLSELWVPLKVIASPERSVLSGITVATNLQTAITETDIQSSFQIAQNVEEYFANSGLDGLRYKRQASAERVPFVQLRVVNTEDLNRAVASTVFGDSSRAIRAPKELSNPQGYVWKDDYPVGMYYFAAMIMYRVDSFFNRNKSSEYSALRAAKYHIGMLAALELVPKLQPVFESEEKFSPSNVKKFKSIPEFKSDDLSTETWAKKADPAIELAAEILLNQFEDAVNAKRNLVKDDVRSSKIQAILRNKLLGRI